MTRARWTMIGYGVTMVAVAVVTIPDTLGGDIRYEIGATAVSTYGAAGTFTHRPLLYRLLSAMITAPAEAVTHDVHGLEIVVRIECVTLVAAAAVVLWFGLRRYVPAYATSVSAVVFAALVLIGPRITLEPDWLAVVLTVLGVGASLALRPRLLSSALGGVLVAAAAATKIVTLPTAVIAVVVLLLLDRRRAILTTISTALVGVVFVIAMMILAPQEIGWLADLGSVQRVAAPLGTTLASTVELLGNAASLWPTVALLPAALVGVPRRLVGCALGGVALAWLPAQIQGQYYPYHLSALPVVAAVVLVLSLRRAPGGFAVLTLGCAGWAAWLISTPYDWRSQHLPWLFSGTAVICIGAFVYRWADTRGQAAAGHGREQAAGPSHRPLGSTVAVIMACLAASTPLAHASISLVGTERYDPAQQRAVTEAAVTSTNQIRAHIGARSFVTYLTFGDIPYFLGNPTRCRYPSPVFLQRGQPVDGAAPSRSWTGALQCITRTPGDWLVWDTSWFPLRRQPPIVVRALHQQFACEHAFIVGAVRVCPRRPA